MDYENFKENFIEALQEDLYGKGIEARFDTKSVEKLNNEGYDAVTITPADSNIGVTINVEAFYKAHENGASKWSVLLWVERFITLSMIWQSYQMHHR